MGMFLEIGPGEKRLGKHWKTLDCIQRPHVDYVARWGEERLPIEDGACELVYSSHCLEHCAWHQVDSALREVYRILQPGGWLEVWVPDFAYIVDCYLKGKCGDNWLKHNPTADPMVWVNGRLFTYGPDPNWHRACFDRKHLEKCLRAAGFFHVSDLEKPRGYDHGAIGLGLRGVKS